MTQEPDIMDFEEAYLQVKRANNSYRYDRIEENHEETWGTPDNPISDQENRRRLWCDRKLKKKSSIPRPNSLFADGPASEYNFEDSRRGYRNGVYWGPHLENIVLQSRLSGEELTREELERKVEEQISVLEESDRAAERARLKKPPSIGDHTPYLGEAITPEMYLETEDYLLAPQVHGKDEKRKRIVGKTSVEKEKRMMRGALQRDLQLLRETKRELGSKEETYTPTETAREIVENIVSYSKETISSCREKIGNALRKTANRFSETEQELPRDDDLEAYEQYWKNLGRDQP